MTVSYTPRFKEGDSVKVVGPFISGKKGPKNPRLATVATVDENDPTWSYQVTLEWRNQTITEWVREENTQPAIVVPKFKTLAEADAWLEKHG